LKLEVIEMTYDEKFWALVDEFIRDQKRRWHGWRMSDDDLCWFDQHPGRFCRVRDALPSDHWTFAIGGKPTDGHVVVVVYDGWRYLLERDNEVADTDAYGCERIRQHVRERFRRRWPRMANSVDRLVAAQAEASYPQ
jgi:hypothetical protein